MHNSIKRYLTLFCIITIILPVNAAPHAHTLYDKIGDLFITSHVPSGPQEIIDEKNLFLRAAEPTDAEIKRVYWNLWRPTFDANNKVAMDEKTIEGLDLIAIEGNTDGTLLGKIPVLTQGGLCYAAQAFAFPTYNLDAIQKRQETMRYLVNNEHVREAIIIRLQKIRDAEARFMSFFGKEHPANTKLFEKVKWWKKIDGLNTNAPALDTLHGTRFLRSLTKMACSFDILYGFFSLPCLFQAAATLQNSSIGASLKMAFVNPAIAAYETIRNVPNGIKSVFHGINTGEVIINGQKIVEGTPGRITSCIHLGIMSAIGGYFAYRAYNTYKHESLCYELTSYMHQQVSALAEYIRAIKELEYIVEHSPQLKSTLFDYHALQTLLAHEQCSSDCAYLIDLLQTDTFNGDASLCMHTGRVVAAYNLAWKVASEFGLAVKAISELDACNAVANMYVQHMVDANSSGYVFVNFVTSAEPLIDAQGFWNPLLDHRKAVVNDLSFGSEKPHGLVVTGINRGGKSTIFKAIAINSVFAQAFGIAAAASWMATPFAMINCYVDIQDSVQRDVSQFQAEIARVVELTQAINDLKSGEYALILCDELFTGTEPSVASQATWTFASRCAETAHLLSVFISHYKEVAQKAEEDPLHFTNYSVIAHEQNNGLFIPMYRIQQGASTQNDAYAMLKQAGIA